MTCPRCGFDQPTDRFCAKCGLNVEEALKVRPPLWRRIGASPLFYFGLIGLLIAGVVMLYLGASGPGVFRGRGDYISSREAKLPGEAEPAVAVASAPVAAAPVPEPVEPVAREVVESEPAAAQAASRAPEFRRFETEFWEISHEQFMTVIEGADRVIEDNAGRAFKVSAERVRGALKSGARPLGPPYREELRANAQVLIETPPQVSNGLHFGLAVQLLKWDNGHANLRLNASLGMTPPEPPNEVDPERPVRPVDSQLAGPFELTGDDTLVILIEPMHRRPRAEFLSKAGAGPWQIMSSQNFRTGDTDWIATIRLK